MAPGFGHSVAPERPARGSATGSRRCTPWLARPTGTSHHRFRRDDGTALIAVEACGLVERTTTNVPRFSLLSITGMPFASTLGVLVYANVPSTAEPSAQPAGHDGQVVRVDQPARAIVLDRPTDQMAPQSVIW